jgi:hypothetical protein
MAISPHWDLGFARAPDDAAWPLAPHYDLHLQLRKVRAEYAEHALEFERELGLAL